VRESGGGYQFLSKKDFHKTVAQLNGEKFLKRLSTAALETLAIIAYKQPITKSEIEAIRGVNCDYSIQKLLEKELIIITGRNENMPGKPLVYATSKSFMDYFGLNSPDELPKLKEIFAEAAVEATVIRDMPGHTAESEEAPQHAQGEQNEAGENEETDQDLDGASIMAVTETGELIEDAGERPE
jgi:segregation and condensation protein B